MEDFTWAPPSPVGRGGSSRPSSWLPSAVVVPVGRRAVRGGSCGCASAGPAPHRQRPQRQTTLAARHAVATPAGRTRAEYNKAPTRVRHMRAPNAPVSRGRVCNKQSRARADMALGRMPPSPKACQQQELRPPRRRGATHDTKKHRRVYATHPPRAPAECGKACKHARPRSCMYGGEATTKRPRPPLNKRLAAAAIWRTPFAPDASSKCHSIG